MKLCEKSIIVLVERIKNKTSCIVVRAGNQMWSIVVFEVATESDRSEIHMHNLRYSRNGKNLKIYGKRNLSISRSHHPERASALDFKDTSAPRFG